MTRIILMMACTADGLIARDGRHYPDWTGSADKRMFKALTMEAGVVIMGSRTFDNIGRILPQRRHVIMTRYPEKRQELERVWFTADTPRQIVDRLNRQGFKQAVLAGGAVVNSLFARAGLIHELVLTVSPLVFGKGIGIFNSELDLQLRLSDCHLIESDTVCLRYKVL